MESTLRKYKGITWNIVDAFLTIVLLVSLKYFLICMGFAFQANFYVSLIIHCIRSVVFLKSYIYWYKLFTEINIKSKVLINLCAIVVIIIYNVLVYLLFMEIGYLEISSVFREV